MLISHDFSPIRTVMNTIVDITSYSYLIFSYKNHKTWNVRNGGHDSIISEMHWFIHSYPSQINSLSLGFFFTSIISWCNMKLKIDIKFEHVSGTGKLSDNYHG